MATLSKRRIERQPVSMTGRLSADAKTQRAVARLVEYLERDEYGHYDGESDHIWHAVKAARAWLGLPRIEDAND